MSGGSESRNKRSLRSSDPTEDEAEMVEEEDTSELTTQLPTKALMGGSESPARRFGKWKTRRRNRSGNQDGEDEDERASAAAAAPAPAQPSQAASQDVEDTGVDADGGPATKKGLEAADTQPQEEKQTDGGEEETELAAADTAEGDEGAEETMAEAADDEVEEKEVSEQQESTGDPEDEEMKDVEGEGEQGRETLEGSAARAAEPVETSSAKAPRTTEGPGRYRVSQSELMRLGATGKKEGKSGVTGIYSPGRPKRDDDPVQGRIAARSLNVELTCPICLSIVHNTHTFMECMHRFCQECIEKYLRLGQKECPKCRMKVSSRRALRPDPQFDKLVQAFYPDREAFEEKEEEFITKVNAENAQGGLAAAVEEGLKRQALAAAGRTEARNKPIEPAEIEASPPPEDEAREEVPAAPSSSTATARASKSQPQPPAREKEKGTPIDGTWVMSKGTRLQQLLCANQGAGTECLRSKFLGRGVRSFSQSKFNATNAWHSELLCVEGEETPTTKVPQVKKPKPGSNQKSFLSKKPSPLASSSLSAARPKFKPSIESLTNKKKTIVKSKPFKKEDVHRADTESSEKTSGGVGPALSGEMNSGSGAQQDDQQEEHPSPPVTPPPPPSIFSRRQGIVEFRLWPHPSEKRVAPLPKDYMCSLETCPMVVIKKYLAKRFQQDDYKSFDLLINTTVQDNAVIPNDLSLGTVVRMLWSRHGELKILFRTTQYFKIKQG